MIDLVNLVLAHILEAALCDAETQRKICQRWNGESEHDHQSRCDLNAIITTCVILARIMAFKVSVEFRVVVLGPVVPGSLVRCILPGS